jgi:hypothetical protein
MDEEMGGPVRCRAVMGFVVGGGCCGGGCGGGCGGAAAVFFPAFGLFDGSVVEGRRPKTEILFVVGGENVGDVWGEW